MINHGNICDFSFYVRAFDTKEHYRNYGQPATGLSLQQVMSEFEKRCADNPVHVNTVLGVNFTTKRRDLEPAGVGAADLMELCEDYDFHNGEDEVSSVLGSLLRYFEKFSKWENAWEDFVDLGDEERNQVLATAYKQYMLNRVTEAVKASLGAYREYNKPWE